MLRNHAELLRLVGCCLLLLAFPGCGKLNEPEGEKPGRANTTKTDPETTAHNHHGGHHGAQGESVLIVRTEPAAVKAGEPVELHLMIHDATGGMISDFDTAHEKKLHLIIVRDGLDQFVHIHPELDRAGNFTVSHAFPTAGKYRLYADFKPTGKAPTTAIAAVNVAGTPPPKPELVPNAPGRVESESLSADIAVEKDEAAGTTRISFTLFDAERRPVADLQPYLGAMGHLVILSADGERYIHSHPLEGESSDAVVAFDAHFSRPGIYKGWGQFRRLNEIHNLPFVLQIE